MGDRFCLPWTSIRSRGPKVRMVSLAPWRTESSDPSTSILIAETLTPRDEIRLSRVCSLTLTKAEFEERVDATVRTWPIDVGLGTESPPTPDVDEREILMGTTLPRLLTRRFASSIA